MVDKNTNFFEIVDNFAKIENIESICVFESNLDFIPKVTIAIPTFNRTDLLKEAIDSALNQINYSNYDVVVVDNNPQRGCETEKLMISYEDSRLSYYKNRENIQMTGNWNRLFTLAKGEYVVMLHDDDLLFPDFLKECISLIDNEPKIGILKPLSKSFSKSIEVNDLMQQIKKETNQNNNKLERLYDISNYSNFALGAPTGCLFKKKSVLSIGGFNPEFFPIMDLCFVVIFSLHFRVYKLNKTLSFYRWADNESLKIEILRGFVLNNYYLRKNILKKYGLPNFVINNYLNFLTINYVKWCTTINKGFCFNMTSLSLKKESKTNFIIYRIIVKVYMLFVKLIKYKKL